MAKPRVLVTSFFVHPGSEYDLHLRNAGIEPVINPWHGGRTEEELIDLLQGVGGAICSIDPFTARVLAAAPDLKVISRTGVGYDAIDVAAATARGILVCTTPGTNQNAVAEYTLALLLACSRRLLENLTTIPRGAWVHYPGTDLRGKIFGIVGLGAIGKAVAQRARAFEMRVLAVDVVQDQAFAAQHQIEYVSLEQLLRESDFVSLHVFLSPETRHMIDAERLALMKSNAYLINTSRGGVVDTAALHEALKAKRIAGAALDVFEQEPLGSDSPLLGLDNIYVSAHSAGMTAEATHAMVMMASESVIRILRGEPPVYAVNPEAAR